MKKKVFVLVLAFALTATLAFAGGKKEKVTITTAPGEPQYGGTLVFMDLRVERDMTSWDPNDDIGNSSMRLGGQTYEYLMAVDYTRGQTGTREYKYTGRWQSIDMFKGGQGLAESWEFPNDTTLIFHLRQGVMWPAKPGLLEAPREMTADDVALVYNQALASPKVKQSQLKDPVESVTAVDRYTLRFDLRYFWTDWPYDLSGQLRMIYSPEAAKAGLSDWRNCHGTGAYQVTDFVTGVGIYCDRNPTYWQKEYVIDGKKYQLPFADKLVLPIIPEAASRIAALRTGKVDVMTKVTWQNVDTLASTNPELRKWYYDNYGAYAIGMRQDTPPFDDIRVRRALSMAIDRQAIKDKLMGGNAAILNLPVPESWKAVYTPLDKLSPETQEAYTYNPERARELLREAGLKDRFKTSIEIMNNASDMDLVSLCADYWSDIGVQCDIKTFDSTTADGRRAANSFKNMLGKDEASPGPAWAFEIYLSDEPAGFSMINDPYIDKTFETGKKEPDVAKALKAWKDLNVYVQEKMYYLFLPQAGFYCYAWPWIRNFEGDTYLSYYSASPAVTYMWIDQDLKKEMGH